MTRAKFVSARRRMVETQLRWRGICDERVLAAMGRVPREQFLPEHLQAHAYDDGPLPLAEGQTISQPYIVARMLELLAVKPHDKVLEIGTGWGYAAAVLAELAHEVHTVERLPTLAERARSHLEAAGYAQVRVHSGDGTQGWPQDAPYDGIIAAAAAAVVPEPLQTQLAPGGRLVLPLADDDLGQRLMRLRKHRQGQISHEVFESVVFVPLVGAD